MIRIEFKKLKDILKEKLLKNGFEIAKAEKCALIFTENNLYGVASHGTNRFPSFIELIGKGYIDPNAEPTLVKSFGSLEQWDANLGPGPLNASFATDRAIELAGINGIGCVALRNSNHWMRAGTYGWQAADKGFILIAFTNAYPMMPPWGSKEPVVGNNPMCIAVPRRKGNVVIDMAMSQFSYGQLANYRRNKEELPYEGGYNNEGELSKDPDVIYKNKRVLPIGLWKGSGLSIMFDLITTILSDGNPTNKLGNSDHDTAMSQVFIAIDPGNFAGAEYIDNIADNIISSVKESELSESSHEVLFPGERAFRIKNDNLINGIPIDESIWERIQAL